MLHALRFSLQNAVYFIMLPFLVPVLFTFLQIIFELHPLPFNIGQLMILTFKNRASYIQEGRTSTLQMLHFIYFFSTNISTEYFKHAARSPFFSSKCHLFYNPTFFGSCISHIFTDRVC